MCLGNECRTYWHNYLYKGAIFACKRLIQLGKIKIAIKPPIKLVLYDFLLLNKRYGNILAPVDYSGIFPPQKLDF